MDAYKCMGMLTRIYLDFVDGQIFVPADMTRPEQLVLSDQFIQPETGFLLKICHIS